MVGMLLEGKHAPTRKRKCVVAVFCCPCVFLRKRGGGGSFFLLKVYSVGLPGDTCICVALPCSACINLLRSALLYGLCCVLLFVYKPASLTTAVPTNRQVKMAAPPSVDSDPGGSLKDVMLLGSDDEHVLSVVGSDNDDAEVESNHSSQDVNALFAEIARGFDEVVGESGSIIFPNIADLQTAFPVKRLRRSRRFISSRKKSLARSVVRVHRSHVRFCRETLGLGGVKKPLA